MATSFDTVIDMALIPINDYKLEKLAATSEELFTTFCDGLLIHSIPSFTDCLKTLTYDATTREFGQTLTNMEISILADYFIITWFQRDTQNASALANALQNTGSFKSHSQAQNLKVRESYYNTLCERVAQKCVDYQGQYLSELVGTDGV